MLDKIMCNIDSRLLSQYNFIKPSPLICKSSRIIFNHKSSHNPCAIGRNSISADHLTTTFSFYFSMLPNYLQEKYNNSS